MTRKPWCVCYGYEETRFGSGSQDRLLSVGLNCHSEETERMTENQGGAVLDVGVDFKGYELRRKRRTIRRRAFL